MNNSVNLTKFSFANNFNFENNRISKRITDSSNFTDSLISSSSINDDLNPRNIQKLNTFSFKLNIFSSVIS